MEERISSRPRQLTLAVAATAIFVLPLAASQAATPSSGTIGPNDPPVAWQGPLTGGASASEATCVEGLNCDTFTLTVGGAPADWTGKIVSVRISWIVPANDYDLYIHQGSISGPTVGSSGSGAPDTDEQAAIDPAATGTGVYTVHVVFFSVAPGDPYQGTATVQPKPVARTATYVDGGVTFSPSVTAKAPVATRDGEPSSRTDQFGNFYVTGIRGVPAGVDLWYDDLNADPYLRNWAYRGQPDSAGRPAKRLRHRQTPVRRHFPQTDRTCHPGAAESRGYSRRRLHKCCPTGPP